jgi:periplasmic divalent cation tolerance protein
MDMIMADFVELVLTCGSWQEAQRIADALLEKHLVACVKFEDVKSKYWWQGKLEEADEVKLSMQTVANNFDKVEAEVKKLHSYDTFVLQQLPVHRVSTQAAKWWENESNPNRSK